MDKYDSFIGKVLDGRYKILEMLGVGGMAFVLKAEDLMMNRIVAIKILNDQYNGDEQAETRFINESKAVAMLSHKNIVSVYDVAIYPDMKYIVMEYLDGITLKEYLDKKGALPWKEACIYIGQVLRALEHAHSKGVIHRDIKPQNIILQKNGEIKVTDFGIAKLPNDSSLTTTEKAIGTVYYISPEQASGKETSFSSDIYSVGVMLYEALTGRLPFVADSPVTIALMQINDQPTPPEEINDQIPLGVSQIVMKAMQKDTAARFATAHGMVKALDCVLRDPEVVFTDNAIAAENSKDNKLVNINLIATGELGEFKLEPEDGQKPEEKPKPHKKKRRIREEWQSRSLFPIITGVFLAFFTVAICVVAYLGYKWLPSLFEPAPDDSFYVDDFVGRIYNDELAASMRDNKYSVTLKDGYNQNYPNGAVLVQDPTSGPKNVPGSYCRITLTINRLYEDVQVPNVRYWKSRDAKKQLEDLGLRVLTEHVNDAYIQSDQVIRTSPEIGDTLRTGDTVTLYVSDGPGNVYAGTMINVVGLQSDDAVARLRGLYYSVKIVEEESQEPDGRVLRQSIAEGTKDLEAWTVVELTVSKYVEKSTVTVPDLFGLNEEEAIRRIAEEGLSINEIFYEPSTYKSGTVIDQSLEPNTEVEPGTPIDIVLSEEEPDEPSGDPSISSEPSDESSGDSDE